MVHWLVGESADPLPDLRFQIGGIGIEPFNFRVGAKPGTLTFGKLACVENSGGDRLRLRNFTSQKLPKLGIAQRIQ